MNAVQPAMAVLIIATTRQSVRIAVPAPVDMNLMSMATLAKVCVYHTAVCVCCCGCILNSYEFPTFGHDLKLACLRNSHTLAFETNNPQLNVLTNLQRYRMCVGNDTAVQKK